MSGYKAYDWMEILGLLTLLLWLVPAVFGAVVSLLPFVIVAAAFFVVATVLRHVGVGDPR